MLKKSERSHNNARMPIIILTTLYLLGNALLLLNRGVYWDGRYYFYLLEQSEWNVLWAHLTEVKLFSLYYVIRLVSLFPHPMLAIKMLAFFSWLIAGILLFIILTKKIKLPAHHVFFISSIFLLIPSFPIKAEFSVLYYSLCNMFFFIGAYIYFSSEGAHSAFVKYFGYLISGIFFFLSFFTNSFLVFYVGFLLITLWYQYKEQWLRKNAFFVALPILFWALKISLGKPEVSYNEFVFLRADFLAGFIKNFWNGIAYGFFWPLVAPITILQRKVFAGLFAIMLVIVYALTKRFLRNDNERDAEASEKYWRYVMAGTFLFFLGLAPYLAVGKAPSIFGPGFAMRHALLLPLGSAFIILGVILSVIQEQWQKTIQIIILTLFCTFSIYTYFTLDMDWYKQKAIVKALADAPELLQTSTLIINDNVRGFEFQNRTILDFEYQTYVNEAFSQEHFKFVIRGNGNVDENNINQMVQEKYLAFLDAEMFPVPPNFDPLTKPVSIEIVSRATEEIYTVPKWLRLKYYELFLNNALFSQKLADELQIVVQLPIVVSRKINVAN